MIITHAILIQTDHRSKKKTLGNFIFIRCVTITSFHILKDLNRQVMGLNIHIFALTAIQNVLLGKLSDLVNQFNTWHENAN